MTYFLPLRLFALSVLPFFVLFGAIPFLSVSAQAEATSQTFSHIQAFDTSASIRAFAKEVTSEAKSDENRAHRLYDAILKLKRSGAIAGDRDNTPKFRPPKSAADLMKVANATGELDRKAGCYEFSALYVAAARSVGLMAVGVERDESQGTGQIGHIMAGVRFEEGGRLSIFDLQNESRGTLSAIRELGDDEFAAHHYNHLAVAAFLNEKPQEAYEDISVALILAPENASFHNNRATVLSALGENDLALADSIFAAQSAPGVPLYRYQLGRLYLLGGDFLNAEYELLNALDMRSRYGLARRDLGWTYLLMGKKEAARRELERVARRRDKTPDAELYLALLHRAGGDSSKAIDVIQKGLKRSADNLSLQTLLLIAEDKKSSAKDYLRLQKLLSSLRKTRSE